MKGICVYRGTPEVTRAVRIEALMRERRAVGHTLDTCFPQSASATATRWLLLKRGGRQLRRLGEAARREPLTRFTRRASAERVVRIAQELSGRQA